MLGQDLSSAKETLRKLWEADMSPLGADAASQELSVMSLAAVWQAAQALQTQYASRRARMEEDPNKNHTRSSWSACRGTSSSTA